MVYEFIERVLGLDVPHAWRNGDKRKVQTCENLIHHHGSRRLETDAGKNIRENGGLPLLAFKARAAQRWH
jgi:hypothetical protein